jgi:hypothetical protein
MTKEALETLISRLEVGALIFGIVVAIGVAGESVYGFRIWWNNRKLHKIQTEETDSLQHEIARLNAVAEAERLARVKIEERVADRHVTLEQRKKMIGILRAQLGANINIWYYTDSGTDTLAYTREIQDVFRDAEWHVFHKPNGKSGSTSIGCHRIPCFTAQKHSYNLRRGGRNHLGRRQVADGRNS